MQNKEFTKAVFIGSHGNEMKVGSKLNTLFLDNPVPGIVHRIAHPKAVAANERYLGSKEIMNCYPGDPKGDPEQIAAHVNVEWLKKQKPTVVFDIHESFIDTDFFAIGRATTLAPIVGAYLLGYTECLVNKTPFYTVVPNAVVIENSLNNKDAFVEADKLYNNLAQIAPLNLEKIYPNNLLSKVSFYEKIEIKTIDEKGEISPLLLELEEIPSQPFFAPLDLPAMQKKQLGIPKDTPVFYGTWGHLNMSKQDEEKLGCTRSGIVRSEYFGDILLPKKPREVVGGRIIF